MRTSLYMLVAVLPVAACNTRSINGMPVPGRQADRVVWEDGDRAGTRGPRALKGVPPGQYPPPGECRVWYPGRPPGQQPPPARCDRLAGRVPRGAFLLYNRKAWDAGYDWRGEERRRPGTVPRTVMRILG